MHVIRVRNVHAALPAGLSYLAGQAIPMPSRAGDVLVAPGPVTTVYDRPTERVLFWPERDANPFFHFFEGLYFLAGRNDVAFLKQFVRDYDRFSDDGKTLHGSYGYRWRETFGFDQLNTLLEYLRKNPWGRRGILSMWDARQDLYSDESHKDIPCNIVIHFNPSYGQRDRPNRLNMTVFCRSNDIIWGAYGSNAVHFSILQEYIAAHLGLDVGTFYQVSDNYHAYKAVFDKHYLPIRDAADSATVDAFPYQMNIVQPYPMVANPATWDRDLALFFEDPRSNGFDNPFFAQVAKPLYWAHVSAKRHAYGNALEILEQCRATDWKKAANEWVDRRWKRHAELQKSHRDGSSTDDAPARRRG